MKKTNGGLLRLIAVFKLLKAALLIAIGVGALKLVHRDAPSVLEHWVQLAGLRPGGRYLDEALGKLASMPPQRMRDVGLGSFVYAALFLTEGTGLWLGKRWAEWFTVVITSSLVPLELYELMRHPTASKVLLLLINVAVVVYLVVRIRREHRGEGTDERSAA